MVVDHPEPSSPMAGAPQCPNISTQFPAKLTMLALTQRERDGRDHVDRLQIPAQGGVGEQRKHTPQQRLEEGTEQNHDTRICPTARISGIKAQMTSASGAARAAASHTPFTRLRRQSRGSSAPNDCATRVSIPSSRPVPKNGDGVEQVTARLPAPMAAAPSRPAMMVSHHAHGHPAQFGERQRPAPCTAWGETPAAGSSGNWPSDSRLGVGLVVHGHQVGERDLRVLLRGGEPGVAQQFLNGAQIRRRRPGR